MNVLQNNEECRLQAENDIQTLLTAEYSKLKILKERQAREEKSRSLKEIHEKERFDEEEKERKKAMYLAQVEREEREEEADVVKSKQLVSLMKKEIRSTNSELADIMRPMANVLANCQGTNITNCVSHRYLTQIQIPSFSFSGSIATMKRNLKNTHNGVVMSSQRDEAMEDLLRTNNRLLEALINKIDTFTHHQAMNTTDVLPFFPANSLENVRQFLQPVGFEERREQFHYYLMPIATMNKTDKGVFSNTLMDLLFTRECANSCRWPCAGYDNSNPLFELLHIVFLSSRISRVKDPSTVVPQRFVTILRMALSRMVGGGKLHEDLIGLKFWKSWSRKFTSLRQHDNRKQEPTSSAPKVTDV